MEKKNITRLKRVESRVCTKLGLNARNKQTNLVIRYLKALKQN